MSLVLIVEDDPLVRATLSSQLHYGKFQTMVAASAKEAMQLASEHKFDLAIVDHGLPDQTGDQLASTMRRYGIPWILFTGMHEEDALLAAARGGAIACLIKPVDMPILIAAARSAIIPPPTR